MVNPQEFYEMLVEKGIDFFTGVPDSLLKGFCDFIEENCPKGRHIVAANEGNAVSMSSGHYLATGKPGLVYMQNSGIGNSINPLLSLCDSDVYSIPVLLLIGWRGEPDKHDEPQHKKQGRITLELLDEMEIPYEILPEDMESCRVAVENAVNFMEESRAPFAIVVKSGTFDEYIHGHGDKNEQELDVEASMEIVLSQLDEKDVVVSTTGKISRILFELREKRGESHEGDFLVVGSMGHCSSVALGIAIEKPDRNVYCFDGDGSFIMHMGSIATMGMARPKNIKHIIFNNFSHDSVGGQPTAANNINIPEIAMASGYSAAFSASKKEEVIERVGDLKIAVGPALLELRLNKGSRSNLGRPTVTPFETKEAFMSFLSD